MQAQQASRTAVMVCQGRAAAHGLIAPDRFSDPVALDLLRPDELLPVEQVRAGRQPADFAERMGFEQVRASAEIMVPRTVAIDAAVTERAAPQLVILGAGLDARAWRLPGIGGATVFEIDHPVSQRDKRERIGDRPPFAGDLRFVPVDFTRDSLGERLAEAGHDPAVATTWVWEGVIPYLTKAEVAATLRALADRSAPGSRVVVNYQEPGLVAFAGRTMARLMLRLAGQRSPWAAEPRRSAWRPRDIAGLLRRYGYTVVRDDDLATIAIGMGLAGQRASLRNGRVAVADR